MYSCRRCKLINENDSLRTQVSRLQSGEDTSVALVERSFSSETRNNEINAFVALNHDAVLAQAKQSDLRRKKKSSLGPLDGVPIAVKDNYLTKDYPTTACSDSLPLEPNSLDATIIANLRDAGAIIFGKTNMHEWAYGATNSTSSFGVTKNPHNLAHITGGSSGGSGAAVASGIVAAALGSDTGGSVRIPSSACGIYGFKPTYGRASTHGVLPLSWSLDAPGPMTSTLRDLPLMLSYMFGVDSKDPSTAHAKYFDKMLSISNPQLVFLDGPGLERSDEVDTHLRSSLKTANINFAEADLKNVGSYFGSWETILHCEAASYHERLLKINPSGYSEVTRAHLEAGKHLSALEFLNAQKLRGEFIESLYQDLPDWDALILPTLPVTVPNQKDRYHTFSGRRVTTQDSMTWFCWPGNLAGLPCLSIPIGKSANGLPIGIMVMGKSGKDEELLAIGDHIDQAINYTGN